MTARLTDNNAGAMTVCAGVCIGFALLCLVVIFLLAGVTVRDMTYGAMVAVPAVLILVVGGLCVRALVKAGRRALRRRRRRGPIMIMRIVR